MNNNFIQQDEIKGWYLKKNEIEKFILRDVPHLTIVVKDRISSTEFTGYIKLPRPRYTDFGFASLNWIKDNEVLGNPAESFITFNGKVFWEIVDFQETTENKVLIILKAIQNR